MATRLYFKSDLYDRAFFGGTYNQGAPMTTTLTAYYSSTAQKHMLVGRVGLPVGSVPAVRSSSASGIDWTQGVIGASTPFSGTEFTDAFYANGIWVLSNNIGEVYTSTDANSWTLRYTDPLGRFLERCRYGNGRFVIVGDQDPGIVITSTDGITWTPATQTVAANIIGVDYSPTQNKWVAVGSGGNIWTAVDPTGTWTATTVGTSTRTWVHWDSTNSLWLIFGFGGLIETSTDAVTWTPRTSGTVESLWSFCKLDNGTYFIAGNNGTLLKSTNLITWTSVSPTPTPLPDTIANYYAVWQGESNNLFVAGTSGFVYKSTDNGATWSVVGSELSSTNVTADAATIFTKDASVLRYMSTTNGSAQTVSAFESAALATQQSLFLGLYATLPLDIAQTVGAGTMILNTAQNASSAAAQFRVTSMNVYVWRPSTAAVVGYIRDAAATLLGGAIGSTTETVQHITGITGSAVNALAGDIIVCEVWGTFTQSMATAYTVNYYYGGSTENTTQGATVSDHASFLEFSENLTFSSPIPVLSASAKKIGFSNVSSYAWTVPADWNNSRNTIEAIGAGGRIIAGATPNLPTGGGGGGAYAVIANLNLTPGSTVYIQANFDADSWVNSAANSAPSSAATGVLAKAGASTDTITGGAGGSAAASIGTITFSGGNGGLGDNSPASNGGGGGAAGPGGSGKAGGDGDTASAGNEGGGGGGGAGGGSSTVGENGTVNGGNGGNGPNGTGGGTGSDGLSLPTDGTINTGGGGGGGAAVTQGGKGAVGGEYNQILWYNNTSYYETTGALSLVTTPVTAGNGNLGTMVTDSTSRFLYVVNSFANSVSQYSINQTTGALTQITTAIASGTAPRGIATDPSGRFVYVVNNTENSVSQYSINQTTGALTQITTAIASGAGPFRVAVDPSGRFVYVVNNTENSVSQYSINQTTGALTQITTAIASGTGPGDVAVDPSGRFVYVVNNTENSVSQYSINQTTGALTQITTAISITAGTTIRNIIINPAGTFLYIPYNNPATELGKFSINQTTGQLTSVNVSAVANGSTTGVIDPTGRFIYLPSTQYSIDQTNGDIILYLNNTYSDPSNTSVSIVTMTPNGRFLYAKDTFTVSSPPVSQFSLNLSIGASGGGGGTGDVTGSYSIENQNCGGFYGGGAGGGITTYLSAITSAPGGSGLVIISYEPLTSGNMFMLF